MMMAHEIKGGGLFIRTTVIFEKYLREKGITIVSNNLGLNSKASFF